MSDEKTIQRVRDVLEGKTCEHCYWRSRSWYDGKRKCLHMQSLFAELRIDDLNNTCGYWTIDDPNRLLK